MLRRHLVLICLLASVLFMLLAAAQYPGGSPLNGNALGFHWSANYICDLFAAKARNGADNAGRLWAMVGMVFHSIGYCLFFLRMAPKIPSPGWASFLQVVGWLNLLLIVLIATPLHDLGTVSIALTLAGLFVITIFLFKTRLTALKIACLVCLATYYAFFVFYGLGQLPVAMVLQKVYVLASMGLVIALDYFTQRDHFVNGKRMAQA